jgi:carboxymethylenebutenolidase
MCEDRDFEEMARYDLRTGAMSRRELGAMTLGAGLAFALPRAASAAETKESEVEIKTPDGVADAYFVHPATGKHPAVIVWPDIFGLRTTFRHLGKRLAESGYAVLVVNPFYRSKKAPTTAEGASFQDPEVRKAISTMRALLNADTVKADALALVSWLDSQAAVDSKRKIGTSGYCMGGSLVFRTAAASPARVGAGASFHGGGLATEEPTSPHLLIPGMKAHYLVAIAENDDAEDPEAKNVLRESFAKAGLPAEIEVYAGSKHGWCVPDSKAYDAEQAEKAWGRMLALFKEALG